MRETLPTRHHFTPECPAGPKMGKVKVLRATPKARVEGVSLTTRAFGFWIHWYDGRSIWCPRDPLRCLGCSLGLSRQWRGYLELRELLGPRTGLVELSEHVAWPHRDWLAGHNGGCRGLTVTLYKEGQTRKSKACLELTGPPIDSAELPPESDLTDRVNRLWCGTIVPPSPQNLAAYRLHERGGAP